MRQYTEGQFRSKVTYVSFVLALFVIGIHTYNVDVYELAGREDVISRVTFWIERYVDTLNDICVPLFFMISGFLFFRTFRLETLKKKYLSRGRTLAVPYILWCTFYYFYFVLCTNAPVIRNMTSHAVVHLSLQEWFSWIWVKEYYTLWFLKALILYVLMAPVNYVVLKNWWKCSGFLVLLLLIGLHMTGHGGKLEHVMNIYYLLGAYIGINHKQLPMKRGPYVTAVCAAVCVLACIYAGWLATNGEALPEAVIMVLCPALWGASGVWDFEKPPKWWMRISFFVYCFHDVWLESFEKLLLVLLGKKSLAALTDYIFMPLIVYAVCAFFAGMMQKFTPKLWRALSGNRV